MNEYEDDIERGIFIDFRKIGDSTRTECIRDISNYPDFSAQLLGIALSGLLYSIVFKLFG